MAFKRMTMGRIGPDDVQVGVPLPFTVYDEHHTLLLREGETIRSQRQLDALFARGVYRVESVASVYDGRADDGKPLERFDLICRELNSLVSAPAGGTLMAGDGAAVEAFPERVASIAARLDDLCDRHAEACLAGILHDQESRYAVRHMVHVAVIARLLAGLLKIPRAARLSLLAAALTMNLAILDLQNELHAAGDRPLTEDDRLQIRGHPQATAARLRELGVDDPVWLAIVEQHHEAFDGSGYPYGLAGEAIGIGARVVNVADSYTARLRQRADREARLANDSLRAVFVGGGFDPALGALLVRAVGIFPPGLIVELENGEIGVVTRLGEQAHAPEVSVIVSAQSTLLARPAVRRTDAAPYRVRHALAVGSVRFRFDPLRFWIGH